MWCTKGGRVLGRGAATLVTGLLVLLSAAPASAHGDGEEAIPARTLVLTALTYLANQPPGFMEVATDKIGDALESEDTAGVDLAEVQAAQRAVERDDMMAARELLQASLAPLTGPVTGEDPGTTTLLAPMAGRTQSAWFGAVLAAVAGALILTGTALAWRWRPAMTLGALRVQAGTTSIGSERGRIR